MNTSQHAAKQAESESRQQTGLEPHLRIAAFPGSRSIEGATYNLRSGVLKVNFRSGASATYSGVSIGTWTAFITAPSKGKFYVMHLKGKF